MRTPRRIERPANGAFARLQRGAISYVRLTEDDFHLLERERPDLIVDDGDALLAGQPSVDFLRLHYAFPDRDVFAQRFAAMLARLLPAVRPEDATFGIRLRFTAMPDRSYVEPALRAQAFQVIREWIEMNLHDLSACGPVADDLATGFLLRPARADDADAIAHLDTVSFPTPYLTPEAARRTLDGARRVVAGATMFCILEDTGARRPAGLLHLDVRPGDTGSVSTIAVDPAYLRRGLGEAMLRWALGWFRSQGLTSAVLTVSAGNAPAIALYRKLGFAAGEIGLDYRRPIDEDEVRQVLEKHAAEHIPVRRHS